MAQNGDNIEKNKDFIPVKLSETESEDTITESTEGPEGSSRSDRPGGDGLDLTRQSVGVS